MAADPSNPAAYALALDGATIGLEWALPFAAILLSIALTPLFAPKFWHDHFPKISIFWMICFLVPAVATFGASEMLHNVLYAVLKEYIPFILLLLALYTISGGVRIIDDVTGSPGINTVMMVIGAILASIMGTTGAAMLLIRSLIVSNSMRKYRAHTVVFFIIIVANIGGALSPLGDPPLFLGFLNGIPFFWPTEHMLPIVAIVIPTLLVMYFVIDSHLFKKESKKVRESVNKRGDAITFKLEGGINILLLIAVIGAVLMSGVWDPGLKINIHEVLVPVQAMVRDFILLILTLLSLLWTAKRTRVKNEFDWFPIKEVAYLFVGIFVTMIPVLAILKAGQDGDLAWIISALSTESGEHNTASYFWVTGLLSSVLDNAPTYLVFFNTAGGEASALIAQHDTLLAISAGAVLFGALSYIGNAPNFMVRSIAQQSGINMPSFFGYMAWAALILFPVYGLITYIFFV